MCTNISLNPNGLLSFFKQLRIGIARKIQATTRNGLANRFFYLRKLLKVLKKVHFVICHNNVDDEKRKCLTEKYNRVVYTYILRRQKQPNSSPNRIEFNKFFTINTENSYICCVSAAALIKVTIISISLQLLLSVLFLLII